MVLQFDDVTDDDSDETYFRIAAEGVELEFEGTEAFVSRQVERFRGFLARAFGLAPSVTLPPPKSRTPAAPSAAQPSSASVITFAAFTAAHPIREGRGAIQERILQAIHHMQVNVGRPGATTEDIAFCFSQAGWETPGSLHNHLGILKRTKGLLDTGASRGLYRLSDAGLKHTSSRYR